MDTGEVLLVIGGIVVGVVVLSALAYLVVRPLLQSTRAWLHEPKEQAGHRSSTDISRRRPAPRPPTEDWPDEPIVSRPRGGERTPIPPTMDTADESAIARPFVSSSALDRLRGEVLRFEQRTGRRPTILAWNEGSAHQYCIHINMPIRNASEDANAYFVCGHEFPIMPPTAIVSVAGALDQYGQAQEQEVKLELGTIRNWRSDQTLLQVYEEILDKLDDGHFEVSMTRSSFFANLDKYAQIVS